MIKITFKDKLRRMLEISKYVDSPAFDAAYDACKDKKGIDKAMLEGNVDMFKKLIGPCVLSTKDLHARAKSIGISYYMHKSKTQLIDEIEHADRASDKRSNTNS